MPFIPKVEANEKPVIIDNLIPTVSFVGYPVSGAADADAKWAIKRIEVALGVTSITWAGGSREKKHKWTERLILQYSRE